MPAPLTPTVQSLRWMAIFCFIRGGSAFLPYLLAFTFTVYVPPCSLIIPRSSAFGNVGAFGNVDAAWDLCGIPNEHP